MNETPWHIAREKLRIARGEAPPLCADDRALAAAAAQDGLALVIRPVRPEDLGYVLGSWKEAHKRAPKLVNMAWSTFNERVKPQLRACLERPDTELTGAYLDGMIVGWLACSRGRRVDVVHWVHTRFQLPHYDGRVEEFRRRGIMRALFDAAHLQPRLAYTFRGPIPKHRAGAKPQSSDEWIVRWLGRRGHAVTYVLYKEWSEE